MKQCQQTNTQSVYEHGISLCNHIFELINYLETSIIDINWKLPFWMIEYQKQILSALLSKDIIKEYTTFHDCGKGYCLIVDSAGKRHFPNHAEKSYETWLSVGGNPQAAKLMKMDMMIHTMKADDIDEFITHPEAITLLLASLSEIHANNKANNGDLNSVNFKIKWKHINKFGKIPWNRL